MIVANVSNAYSMLEQVVNYFHEMSETNPDFFINDNDFLDVWDVDQKEALMMNF